MGTAWHTFRRDLFGMVSPDSKGARCGKSQLCHLRRFQHRIKGLDNPTTQLLPIMSTKCRSGDGEGRKDKGGGGESRGKTKLCVCDKVVCKRWCLTKKDGVCDKNVCERWCVTKRCVKDGVSKMVGEKVVCGVKDGV